MTGREREWDTEERKHGHLSTINSIVFLPCEQGGLHFHFALDLRNGCSQASALQLIKKKKKILREEEKVFFLYQQREWSAML